MEIFVGNLPFSTTEQEVREAFAPHGEVASVKILTDKFTGRSRGMGFVVMDNEDQAKAAIAALNGTELGGRALRVDVSRPREPRNNGGGFKPRGRFKPRRFRENDENSKEQ